MGQKRALLWIVKLVAYLLRITMVSAVVVRGFDGHRERSMITGICYGFASVGAAWSVGVLLVWAGPVGLVEHRPRRPEAAHSLSLDRAAGITRPIESASTLMPPGMLRGPKAAAARSARCTWVCVDMHTECASLETHRQQTTEACRCQL